MSHLAGHLSSTGGGRKKRTITAGDNACDRPSALRNERPSIDLLPLRTICVEMQVMRLLAHALQRARDVRDGSVFLWWGPQW
jgi:hypothetical protein